MNAARVGTWWSVGIVAIVLVACSTPTPSAAPSASPGASASPEPISTPTSSATSSPVATTSPTAVPNATATPGPSADAEACPIAPQTGRLPSDRMVDVQLSSTPTADLVTFVFGEMSLPEPPQGVSEGSLQAAVPPYTEAGSGAEIDLSPWHVAQVVFTGMSLVNDVGEPTYDGPLVIPTIDWDAIQVVRNFDMSEGVIGWYIGYDGNGCVTLSSTPTSVTVAIDHPRS